MEEARMLGMEGAVGSRTVGGRSATGVPRTAAAAPPGAVDGNGSPIPDPAVPEKPERWRFAAEYTVHILGEADCCTRPGQLGVRLRREGLDSSQLTPWRQQRDRGTLARLVPKRRGRKPNPHAALIAENQGLHREIQRLGAKLRRTEATIEVQNTVRGLGDWPAIAREHGEQPMKVIEELWRGGHGRCLLRLDHAAGDALPAVSRGQRQPRPRGGPSHGGHRTTTSGSRCSMRPMLPIPNASFGDLRRPLTLPREVWIAPPADGSGTSDATTFARHSCGTPVVSNPLTRSAP